MVRILAGDDLGRHARVVAVPLDQARGTFRRTHAAFRMLGADVLRILRHAHPQFRPLELQRLDHVVIDRLSLAMHRAMLHVFRRRSLDFVTRQVLGKFLLAGLARLPATLVRGHRHLRVGDRLSQAFGRVGGVRRVPQVQLQLVRIFQVSLPPLLKGPLQKLRHRQFQFHDLLLGFAQLRRDLLDGGGQLQNQRLAGLQVVGNCDRVRGGNHAAKCTDFCAWRKPTKRKNEQISHFLAEAEKLARWRSAKARSRSLGQPSGDALKRLADSVCDVEPRPVIPRPAATPVPSRRSRPGRLRQ